MSLSPPSTFLCVAGSCTVVDKNAHTIGAIQVQVQELLHPVLEKLDKGSESRFEKRAKLW